MSVSNSDVSRAVQQPQPQPLPPVAVEVEADDQPPPPPPPSTRDKIVSFLKTASKLNVVATVMATASYVTSGLDLVSRVKRNVNSNFTDDQKVLIGMLLANTIMLTDVVYVMGKRYGLENVSACSRTVRAVVMVTAGMTPLLVSASPNAQFDAARGMLAISGLSEVFDRYND